MALSRGFARPGVALLLAQAAASVAAASSGCSGSSQGSGGGDASLRDADAGSLLDALGADAPDDGVSPSLDGADERASGDGGPIVDAPDADAITEPGKDAPYGCATDSGPLREVDPATACSIIQQEHAFGPGFFGGYYGKACSVACVPALDGGTAAVGCVLPDAFVSEVEDLNADAGKGVFHDGGVLACPVEAGPQPVQCFQVCKGGRFTEGFDAPEARGPGRAGKLAEMAYLEAVSVHAFARLERELRAHGAPPSLVRQTRRARRDEVRHAAMMQRLARRRGEPVRSAVAPVVPVAAAPGAARSLVAIAIENAVEGCVHETYSAVACLVEAVRGPDADVRRAMLAIGADECRHAALAWAVAAWAMPRLDPDERTRIVVAMREAIDGLPRAVDGGVTAALEARLWRAVA